MRRPRPRGMRWLSQLEYEEVSALAFESVFHEPDARPQCKQRQTSDPVAWWDSRLKQAYRKWRRNRIPTVPLDDFLSSTIGTQVDPVLQKTLAAEINEQLQKELTEQQWKIVELTADDATAEEIVSSVPGATLYAVKKVRAKLVDVERELAESTGLRLAQGCRQTVPKINSDDRRPVYEEHVTCGQSLDGWSPPVSTETQAEKEEIRAAIRNIEARKSEMASQR